MVPTLLFSADILHSQGAGDFAFVNFLALVLRALRVLKNRVSIQIPTPNDSPFGIDVRDFGTSYEFQLHDMEYAPHRGYI
jgi:hypothetical protein